MSPDQKAVFPSLAGRGVIITGGADGIGEAMVRAFAAQRARVGFLDIMDARGRELAATLNAAGGDVTFEPADVTDIKAFQVALAGLKERVGPIKALVNNAANDTRHDWRTESSDQWDGRIAVNLKHFFFAIQAIAPGMIDSGGGSIVNFGSISWMVGSAGLPTYTTAKAAVHGLTRFFARDLGKHRIRVNTVLPGWVMTRRQKELWVDEAAERTIDERQCLPDRLQPDDLARTVLFLAADDSSMMTSQHLIVDGGWV